MANLSGPGPGVGSADCESIRPFWLTVTFSHHLRFFASGSGSIHVGSQLREEPGSLLMTKPPDCLSGREVRKRAIRLSGSAKEKFGEAYGFLLRTRWHLLNSLNGLVG